MMKTPDDTANILRGLSFSSNVRIKGKLIAKHPANPAGLSKLPVMGNPDEG
ncbi:MAG: hypothetical protein LBV43_06445 [Prevotella sp.]|nr:hypothetical protein [Prevotella sp.]